jgi:hypothetical protein
MRFIQFIIISFACILLTGCSLDKLYQKRQVRNSPFQQIDFQAMVKHYLKKDKANPIEGIYTVSGSVTKKGKGLLGNSDKEKITDRKDNYARVAIIRDPEQNGRDYIELSLDKESMPSYSVIGEFTTTTSGTLMVYKHLDAKSKNTTYNFTYDDSGEILEGVRVVNDGNQTVTYKLTYVKTYPKK